MLCFRPDGYVYLGKKLRAFCTWNIQNFLSYRFLAVTTYRRQHKKFILLPLAFKYL